MGLHRVLGSGVVLSFGFEPSNWFLVGNEGIRALYIPFKGLYYNIGYLIPSYTLLKGLYGVPHSLIPY